MTASFAQDRLHDYRQTLRGWLAEHVPANTDR